MLSDIPAGSHCFIDANILCYYIIKVPAFSAECSGFIKRIERREIAASTSASVIAEAIHKVMLAEAVQVHGLDHKGLAHRLQRKSDLIVSLKEHLNVTGLVKLLGIHVEPTSIDLLEAAAICSTKYKLLTNDALTIATMQRLGLTNLVTNDDNFDGLSGVTVWKPRVN